MKKVNKVIAGTSLDREAVVAQTLALKLFEVEKLERMIAEAESRRKMGGAKSSMIERRWRLLRQVTRTIEDAEFLEVPKVLDAAE